MKSFREICELIIDAPGVEDAIIQRTVTRDKIAIAKAPGSDAWQEKIPFRDEYRVFVRTEKGFCEETGTGLMETIRKVFSSDKLGVDLPKELNHP